MKKEKKKDSALSLIACILAFFSCTCWIGLIVAIVDLAKNDKTKRHIGSIFAIFISIMVLLLGVGTGDTDVPDTTIAEVLNVDVTESSATTAEIENSTENKDSYNIDGLLITMKRKVKNYTDYDSVWNNPKDGNKYIKVVFEYVNNSDEDKYVSIYDFDCYADDANCDEVYIGDDDFINTNLSPGRNVKFPVYFEVPKNAKSIELEYKNYADEKALFIIK